MSRRVVIVGGGISGLSCAYFLAQQGIRPTLIEKAPRLGGLIRTDNVDGCELEAGPDSFLAAKTSALALAQELGIENKVIPSNDSRRRVLMARHGKLTPMPPGMVMMVPAKLGAALRSSFFSAITKLGFLRELAARPRSRSEDVSIRTFVTDHFGEEMLANVVEPLLAGVYGGEAAELSAPSVLPRFVEAERETGSLIRGMRRQRPSQESGKSLFLSFEGGMQTLVEGLERQHSADVLHAEVQSLERLGGGWAARTNSGDRFADDVVVAAPAHSAGAVLRRSVPDLSGILLSIPYSSAILTTFLFDADEFEHPLDAFGFLVPEAERDAIAAATWVNTKFPSRIAPGRIAIRAFIVSRQADRMQHLGDTAIVQRTLADLRRWMGFGASPLYSGIVRWPRSMPQYTVGHADRVGRIEHALEGLPGLHLTGNAYWGIGVPDCIRASRTIAHRIAANSN